MNRSIKCAAALTGCAVFASASVMTAFADNAEVTNVKINKPYLNVLVQGEDGKEIEGLDLKLVDENGNAVAEWTSGDEKNAVVVDGIIVVDGDTDLLSLPVDNYNPEKDGEMFDSENQPVNENNDGSGYRLDLGSEYSWRISGFETDAERITIEAGKIVIYVDENYGEYATQCGVAIDECNLEDTVYFNDHPGEVLTYTADNPGDTVERWIESNGIAINGGLITHDHDVNYVKVTCNISELTKGRVKPDATLYYNECYFDLKTPEKYDSRCCFFFQSGSVISACLPDENGNVSVWVSEEETWVDFEHMLLGAGASTLGLVYKNFNSETITLRVDDIEVSDSGLTLYDIPEGEYTVVSGSEEYELVNGGVSVTGVKDLQTLTVTAKTATNDSSIADTSSVADSSSVTDDSSAADSSSVLDTSSVSVSSAAESSQTSSAAQSSSKSGGAATKNDSNPATGAAAGGAAVAVLAAGALSVVKKKSGK